MTFEEYNGNYYITDQNLAFQNNNHFSFEILRTSKIPINRQVLFTLCFFTKLIGSRILYSAARNLNFEIKTRVAIDHLWREYEYKMNCINIHYKITYALSDFLIKAGTEYQANDLSQNFGLLFVEKISSSCLFLVKTLKNYLNEINLDLFKIIMSDNDLNNFSKSESPVIRIYYNSLIIFSKNYSS